MGVHVFTLLGVPVHFTAWYLIMMVYFGLGGDPTSGLLWAFCVTFSILVHELGDAMIAKYYRLTPSIVLHGWGGLCAHERAERDLHDFFIIAAGPGAGLILGGIVYVGTIPLADWLEVRPLADQLVSNLLFVNIFWSFVNLLPLWPLDGGQIFRIVLLQVLKPALAERITHFVGAIIGIAGVGISLQFGSTFTALLAGLLTWQNIQRINDTRASGPIRIFSKLAKGRVPQARAAFAAKDYKEAARLCHQVRADNIDTNTLNEVWEILALCATATGAHEEAWSYLNRAPKNKETIEAKAKCAIVLDKRYEASQLIEHEKKRLSQSLQDELTRYLAAG